MSIIMQLVTRISNKKWEQTPARFCKDSELSFRKIDKLLIVVICMRVFGDARAFGSLGQCNKQGSVLRTSLLFSLCILERVCKLKAFSSLDRVHNFAPFIKTSI